MGFKAALTQWQLPSQTTKTMPRPNFKAKNPPPTPEEIKNLRGVLGLSMPKAAELLQVSAASWETWESGRHRMPAPVFTLLKIAVKDIKALDV